MPLIIPPGFGSAAIELDGALGTPTHITTIGVDLSDVGGDYVAAANNVFQSFWRAFRPQLSTGLTVVRVTLAVGQDGAGGSVESSLAPVAGQAAGAKEAVAMAPIFRKITNELGRRGRGRMFIPGLLGNNVVNQDGSISTSAQTDYQNCANAFMSGLELGQVASAGPPAVIDTPPTPPVLLHSQAPTTPTVVSELVVQPLVGWVRGRIR